MPLGMSANGMNSGLCVPKILLKGTTKNGDKGVVLINLTLIKELFFSLLYNYALISNVTILPLILMKPSFSNFPNN